MTKESDIFSLYNRRLLDLSGQAEEPLRLARPDATARAVSPICGSEVEIDLALDGDRVRGFGYAVDACALTKSVVAVMKSAIVGKTRDEIRAAGAALEKMLAGESGDSNITLPAGDWAELEILLPVRDYKSRHNALLLPFEAVEKAFNIKS